MTDTDLTGRIGVNLIEGIVLNDLGWVFREQHVSDEGIDAQVETKVDDKTTGRLLALQIKTGPSYFTEPKDAGWLFRFGERQARLWLDHALPVILILIDAAQRVAYWQVVSPATVVSTGKKYKVHVPEANRVPMARDAWQHLASGIQLRAHERYDAALAALPPGTARIIAKMHQTQSDNAAVLALHLAEGRRSPGATVSALVTAEPHWLPGEAGQGWVALALYAAAHEQLSQSADAFELAAAASEDNRGKRLAAAGINATRDDRDRAAALLDEAAAFPEAEILVRIGRAILQHPRGIAGPLNIDPPLDPSLDEVRSDALTQSFLSDQAMRSGRIEDSIDHARRALELEPDHADHMRALGTGLARRSLRARGSRGDLSEAASLLAQAVDQRHAWDGPTGDALTELVRALTISGNNEAVLKYSLGSPLGIARPEESARPEVLRHALFAAYLLSREELVAQLAARLGTTAMDQLERSRVGLLELTDEERISLWLEVADTAETTSDYQSLVSAVTNVSRLGRDETSRLRELAERGIIQEETIRLVELVARAYTDLDAVLPELRTLSRSDIAAAEHQIAILVDQNRIEEAAAACRTAHELFNQDYFLIAEAQVYLDGKEYDKAEKVAATAISSSDFPRDRARLLTFLAGRAADRGDWVAAEDYLARVLPLHTQTRSADVWRLVIAQLNRGEAIKAAETVRKYSPVVRNSDEARWWMQSMASVPWDQLTASEALALATKFEHDHELSVAILLHIIQSTTTTSDPSEEDPEDVSRRATDTRPMVTADLHKRAFSAIERHIDENPESVAIRRLQGTTEELLESVSEILKRDSERNKAIRELLEKVQQGELPIGLLATGTGKSYALLLIQQATGPLVAAAAQDEEHVLDQETAASAINQGVVMDSSALLFDQSAGGRRHASGSIPRPSHPGKLPSGHLEGHGGGRKVWLRVRALSVGMIKPSGRPTLN